MKYEASLEIINNETGEIINISELTKDINNIEFEELTQRLAVLKNVYLDILGLYRVTEYKFIQEMNNREARRYTTHDFEIKLSPQTEYKYNSEYIHKIKELISDEEFNKVFTEEYKVNRTFLKSLVALGGDIKELIDNMQTKLDKKPTITVTIKK